MKKVFKWVFIVIIVAVFAIDMAGFWKFKLKGSKNKSTVANDSSTGIISNEEQLQQEPEKEYKELSSSDMTSLDRMFIRNIEETIDGFEVKGIKFSEVQVTKAEYDKLKNGETVEIMDIVYSKDKIMANNLILKSDDVNAKKLYIKQDVSTKKYQVIDYDSDFVVYKNEDECIKVTINGNTPFSIITNGKETKKTVAAVSDSYKDVKVPEDISKLNLATITFNKKGVCSAIKEVQR